MKNGLNKMDPIMFSQPVGLFVSKRSDTSTKYKAKGAPLVKTPVTIFLKDFGYILKIFHL